MLLGGEPGGVVRHGQLGRGSERLDERVLVERIDQHACLGGHELRVAADGRADDRPGARERLERRLAERLDERRLAERRPPRRRRPASRSCSTAPASSMPGRPSSSPRSGPTPTNVSVPWPSRSNARASRTTFFRSRQRADAEEPRPVAVGARERRGSARGRRRSSRPPSCRGRRARPPRAGRAASRRRRSPSRARRTTSRVASRTGASSTAFATSWPWAVTTSGARASSAAERPVGTRKCA